MVMDTNLKHTQSVIEQIQTFNSGVGINNGIQPVLDSVIPVSVSGLSFLVFSQYVQLYTRKIVNLTGYSTSECPVFSFRVSLELRQQGLAIENT